MKNATCLFALLLLIAGATLGSCKKDDPKPAQPAPGQVFVPQSFSGTVNDTAFTADNFYASRADGILTISASAGDQSFKLIFEETLIPGVYQLPGSEYHANGIDYSMIDGSLYLGLHDTQQKVIAAEFLMQMNDFSGAPDKLVEGEFCVRYE